MNHVSKIIIIIMKRIKSKGNKESIGGEGERWREMFVIIFFYLCFFLISMEIGPYVFIGAEGKVDSRSEGNTWVPKYWSFVKLHEIGNFPTYVIFSLKVI